MAKKTSSPRSAANRLSNLCLTITPGSALVQGNYPVRLIEGTNRFQIEGLPTQYDPLSLYFDEFVGTGEVTLGPVSYRGANLTQQSLLQKSVNKKVTVRFGGATDAEQQELRGTLVSFQGNNVCLIKPERGAGKVRELRNVQSYVFDVVPEGLSNTPSLSVEVQATADGDYVARLMFKANGLNWSADYKLIYDEKAGTVNWDASVFLSNSSGASYPDATIRLVAGDTGGEYESMDARGGLAAASFAMESAPSPKRASRRVNNATSESVGQVKVFSLPGKGNVEEGESQKVPFFTAAGVPVKRENRVSASYGWHARNQTKVPAIVATHLLFTNDTENKLGKPLPSGPVAVMMRDSSGALLKSGGAYLGELAVGEKADLTTGSDFDLKAWRILSKVDKAEELLPESKSAEPVAEPNEGGMPGFEPMAMSPAVRHAATPAAPKKPRKKKVTYTKTCEIELFNGKDYAVEFIVEESLTEDLRFDGEHGFTQTDANKHERTVSVAAGATTKVGYTLVQTEVEEVEEE